MSNMWVVTLTEQLDDSRNLLVVAEHDKPKRGNSSSSNVIANIRDSDVEQFADRLIVSGSRVSHRDSEHATVS
jgi:hypothetical protein